MKAPHQKVTFEQLIAKVNQAEDVLEARERQVVGSYQRLTRAWRDGWTPGRIIAAGMVSGFLVGRAEPLRALSGARALQMIGALSGLFASAKATVAAGEAKQAANTAEAAADEVAVGEVAAAGKTGVASAIGSEPAAAPYQTPSSRGAGTPDQVFSTQPRAAEASTEVSER